MKTTNTHELANENSLPYLLTQEQVCEVFQISRMQLWRLEKLYGLRSIKVGKKMKRYSIPDLENFISEGNTE
jgi:hypothetical protein